MSKLFLTTNYFLMYTFSNIQEHIKVLFGRIIKRNKSDDKTQNNDHLSIRLIVVVTHYEKKKEEETHPSSNYVTCVYYLKARGEQVVNLIEPHGLM